MNIVTRSTVPQPDGARRAAWRNAYESLPADERYGSAVHSQPPRESRAAGHYRSAGGKSLPPEDVMSKPEPGPGTAQPAQSDDDLAREYEREARWDPRTDD